MFPYNTLILGVIWRLQYNQLFGEQKHNKRFKAFIIYVVGIKDMPDYTFQTLSPIDFENLVRDLLQSELSSVRLECFKAGKDFGIDLRHSKSEGSDLIVQAKHYIGTGFKGLLSDLKLKEKPKIDRLQPTRYILATSVPLSPANKEQIIKVLLPHIKSPDEIYGKEDLNNLLGLFPNIEKQHFKLWLSSTTVLEEIVHSKILNQTRFTLQDIADKARVYVANQSFNNALNILKEYNYVIIAGIPGIGKTTLANMLVLHYLKANYDFIDVSYDVSEAYSMPDRKGPRVYLYDDFLGRTAIEEKLRKNEDHRLCDFISSIRKRNNSKLILTTREYILHQAQTIYEILNGPIFEIPKCIVDLSQYTRPIRAQILYNHLYFSQLHKEYVEEIVRQSTFLEIIDHPNYSPRIIEYMTDPMWIGSDKSSMYPTTFLRNLKEPYFIWEQAFDNQITDVAREILLVLGTLPREIFVDDLNCAAMRFLEISGYEATDRKISRALSELQGNFVIIRRDRGNDIISFHNPSVQDFIESYIDKKPSLFESFIKSACFYEQVQWITERANKVGCIQKIHSAIIEGLKSTLSATPCALINHSSDRGRSIFKTRWSIEYGARLGFIASLIRYDDFSFLRGYFRELLMGMTKKMLDMKISNTDLLGLSKKVAELDCISDLKESFFIAAKESLYTNTYWVSDASCVADLIGLCPQVFSQRDHVRLAEQVREIVNNHLGDDDAQLLSDELSSLEEIEEKLKFGLSEQIESVRDMLSAAEENDPQEDDYDDDRYRGHTSEQSVGNDALTDMFSTLLR